MVDLNQIDLKNIKELSLSELKSQSPANLLKFAEKIEIDNASTMRKGDMMFAILKEMAENGVEIYGDGVLGCTRRFWFFKINRCELSSWSR